MPVGEGLKPIFGCFLFDVAKAVRKGRDTGLQLWEDSFVSIPISVARYLETGVLIVGVGSGGVERRRRGRWQLRRRVFAAVHGEQISVRTVAVVAKTRT